jgi:predicted Zn-dependent protease
LTDLASEHIDKAAGTLGVSQASGRHYKKAVIPKDDEDSSTDGDIVYNAPKSKKYLNNVFDNLQKTAKVSGVSVYMLRTARVQGTAYWGADVRITRGMFNMIGDEAELVCLLGYEIGHIALKHSENRFEKSTEIYNAVDSMTDAVLKDNSYKGVAKKQQKINICNAVSCNNG